MYGCREKYCIAQSEVCEGDNESWIELREMCHIEKSFNRAFDVGLLQFRTLHWTCYLQSMIYTPYIFSQNLYHISKYEYMFVLSCIPYV